MGIFRYGAVCVVVASLAMVPETASADELWRVDGMLTLSRFEQQIKTEIGGERGERLVEETAINTGVMGTWNVWGPLSLGGYARLDLGTRSASRFEAFDANNKTVTSGEVGGSYRELWVGPLLRAHWNTLFVELGYGALGLRWDDARDDIPSVSGETGSVLETSPTVAWLAAFGAGVPLVDNLQLVLRLEYRVRYYDSRGGEKLAGEAVHGTQNFTPFFGLAWVGERSKKKPMPAK